MVLTNMQQVIKISLRESSMNQTEPSLKTHKCDCLLDLQMFSKKMQGIIGGIANQSRFTHLKTWEQFDILSRCQLLTDENSASTHHDHVY